jgi:hypothetical protein
MLQITCGQCGYTMLSDSDRLVPSDKKTIIFGLTAEQEAAGEADGSLDMRDGADG